MNSNFAEFEVVVPASQFVKVEALAAERSRSLEATASFLLSEWVHATRAQKGTHGNSKRTTTRKAGAQ